MDPATAAMLMKAAQELASQRAEHEKAKMASAQAGMKQVAEGAGSMAQGQQTALDRLMDVYKTAFVGR